MVGCKWHVVTTPGFGYLVLGAGYGVKTIADGSELVEGDATFARVCNEIFTGERFQLNKDML